MGDSTGALESVMTRNVAVMPPMIAVDRIV